MTVGQDSTPSDASTVSSHRLLGGIIVVAAVAGGAWFYLQSESQKRDRENALAKALADNEMLQKQNANLQVTVADIKKAALYEREKETLAKDELSVVLRQAEEINQRLLSLAKMKTEWEAALDQTKDDAAGMRIAGDAALVDLVDGIIAGAPDDDAVPALTERLHPMLAQLHEGAAAESVSFKPTEEFTTRIEEIEGTVEETEQWYRDHLHQLEALKEQTSGRSLADRTLREALANREADRAKERVALQAELNRRVQRERDETVGAAKAASERAIAKASATAIEKLGEQVAADILQSAKEKYNAELAKIRAREEEQRLVQLRREFDRDLATVQAHLQPFIADGYSYRSDDQLGPVSLSVLEGRGALKPGREGLQRLLYLGGEQSRNDRSRGGFPMYIGGRNGDRLTNWDFVQTAQDLIRKYGEVLIERNMLAK